MQGLLYVVDEMFVVVHLVQETSPALKSLWFRPSKCLI